MEDFKEAKNIIITGGAGYVGCELVDQLYQLGHNITIYDTFWFCGASYFQDKYNHRVTTIQGDIRDYNTLEKSLEGQDAIIHLACISNDPSFDLNPELGKSINYSCFEKIVQLSKSKGIERFLFASSSSVYGVKTEDNVTEDLSKEPLTDYSKYKALCEEILIKYADESFCTTSIRPATVCGTSKRQRLDVIVNILTNHAFCNKKIKVFNGAQKRPNIHIKDMARAYIHLLNSPASIINKKTYNVGGENLTIDAIAKLVSQVTGVTNVEKTSNEDIRSYHISSQKIKEETGFETIYSVESAIKDLYSDLENCVLKNSMENSLYFNVKFIQENHIK